MERAPPLRAVSCDRARVPGRKCLRGAAYRGRGAYRCGSPARRTADAARRLLARRAHDRALAAGRTIRARPGVPGALGRTARAGAALARLDVARLRVVTVLLVLAGGVRSALRTPVWHDDFAVTLSILTDSPNSFRGPQRMAERAYARDPAIYITGADAAFTLGQFRVADSMLVNLEQLCYRCGGYYRIQSLAARQRGDTAAADSLWARMP